jgi:hypothetical protein
LPEFLPAKASETGTWSATIHAESGDNEVQTQGSISFPIRLSPLQSLSLKVRYLNEKDVEAVTTRPECPGNGQEPEAAEGWLCIFQGATATKGSLETEWKNVQCPAGIALATCATTPTFVSDPAGNKVAGTTNYAVGALVVYRTSGYVEGAPETKLGAGVSAILNADGSFAVHAKE